MTSTPSHTAGTGSAPVLGIIVRERLRTDTADVRIKIEEDLVPSIVEHGLIHPIVLHRLDKPERGPNILGDEIESDLVLGPGWSRLTAFALLKYDTIPFNFRDSIDPSEMLQIELEENIRRNEMSWQDIAVSIRKIHYQQMSRVAEYNRGRDKKDQLKPWGQRATGRLLGVALGDVNNALILAEQILRGDEQIIAAANPHAANNILLQRREDEIAKHLAENTKVQTDSIKRSIKPTHRVTRERPAAPADSPSAERPVQTLNPSAERAPRPQIDLSHMLFNLDSIYPQSDGSPAFLDRLESDSVDLFYVDPPFAIDMDDLIGRKDIERVVDAHDVGENLDQMPVFFKHVHRILKDRSYFLQWCDIKNWDKFAGRMVQKKKDGVLTWTHEKGWLEQAGFTVCPYPIIWHKTHPCKNQASGVWPTKSFEYVCIARKGKGNLIKPIPDSVFSCSGTTERKLQSNPFAKPFEFTKWLLDYFIRPGSLVVDCYAGEGSIVRALLNLGMNVIACEKDPLHYNRLVEHVKKHYRSALGEEVEFV